MTDEKRQDFRAFLLGMLVNKVPRNVVDDLFTRLKEDLITLHKFNTKVDSFRQDLGGEQPEGTQALDLTLEQWKSQKFQSVMADFAGKVAKATNEYAPGHAFTQDEALIFLQSTISAEDLPFTETSSEGDTTSA